MNFLRGVLSSIVLLLLPASMYAASPSAGGVSRPGPASLTTTWSGGPFTGVSSSPLGANCTNSMCDNFSLTVGTVNAGDVVTIGIRWDTLVGVSANDFDLHIYSGTTEVGTSANGAPGNSEEATIAAIPGVYTVTVLVYSVVNTSYYGKATLKAGPAARTPTYAAGSFTFSPNITVSAPVTVTDGEPSIRVDKRGNVYTAGIRGVPAGVDLWKTNIYTDPCAAHWTSLGSPDAFRTPGGGQPGPADGGGDVDLAVGFPSDASLPRVYLSSLSAANVAFANSTDGGQTFFLNPAVAEIVADDRQWDEAYGKDTVYLLYRAPIPFTGLFVEKSTNGGTTFGPASVVSASGTTPGYIAVDQNDGTVYACHASSSQLFVASSKNAIQWSNTLVANTSPRHLFPVVKVDRAGNVYALWSDGVNINLSVSTDHAKTWSTPVQVNNPADTFTKTNIFPWMDAGDAGRVDIVWYATDSIKSSSEVLDNNDWHVYFSQTLNALATNISFSQKRVSDHIIHHGNISQGGLTGTANRNLLDYFQVAIDPQGAAVISYADDHNDFFGNVYTARQTSGSSVLAATPNVPTVSGCTPPPFHTDPEVVDFAPDAQVSIVNVPADAVDIMDIDYGDETIGGNLFLLAKIRVLDLTAGLPPNAHWRCYLAFSHDIADKGKEYYMELNNDGGVQSFKYGTVVRTTSGGYTETAVGNLDGASVSLTKPGIIRLRILASKLTKPGGSPPVVGDTVLGTKGRTFVSGAATTVRFDRTRGGTAFIIGGGPGGGGGGILVECDDPAISMKGGWHDVKDDRASNGHYCRNVGANKGNGGAFMEFQFHGTGVEMDIARGPRGGNADVLIDGVSRGKLEFFRPASNPSKPDNSGQVDLTFGIKQTYTTTQGSHTFRLNVLNDNPDPKRNMVYVDDFVIEGGDIGGTGSPTETSTLNSGVVGALGLASQTLAATTGTQLLTAVLGVPDGSSEDLVLIDPDGGVVAQSTGGNPVEVVQAAPSKTGIYTVQVLNKTFSLDPYSLYLVRAQTVATPSNRLNSRSSETRPQSFALYQNYPNPFNPVTYIRYSLPEAGFVKITVHNLLGQEVANLVSVDQQPGNYSVSFDASRLSSGVYYYRLRSGLFGDIKRMLLLK